MIELPFPVPTNGLYRNVRGLGRVKTSRYCKWIDEAGWQVKTQSIEDEMLNYGSLSYHLNITLARPDKRKRDLDNCVKAISDLLVTHGITPDDSLMQSLTVRWADAQDGPTVKVRAA